MLIENGMIVKSTAGRDKGIFFVVLQVCEPYALIADGKVRPAEKPKKKKLIHLAPTAARAKLTADVTNRQLKQALAQYNNAQAVGIE